MERSFAREVEALRLGEGETFHGEGILAITKALLQSGVAYVGGYQGSPVSHMVDVLADARDILDELGVHFEASSNEAAAAAMLGASINYPMRGAAVWKSTVGTNVASDALSNLASAGVKGGALVILGEDYGEGASIIQERSHAFAMKSQMWLLDPRPELGHVVDLVEKAFELSEASNTPVMMEFRIRACHLTGSFAARDNRAPSVSRRQVLETPDFDYGRICLPPATYAQEKHKIEHRFPAALRFIREHGLNEWRDGELSEIGILTQGGLANSVIRALQRLGLADEYGRSRVPLGILNVTYPLVPEEIERFCRGKRAVLIVEEGQPAFIEQAVGALLRRTDVGTAIVGKDVLPLAGEYVAEVLVKGIARFLEGAVPKGVDLAAMGLVPARIDETRRRAATALGAPMPKRPPTFCTGCPERPVFSAIRLVERDMGKLHIAADIGCHTFSTLPPFNLGNSVLGYGLGLSSAAAVTPAMKRRTLSVMGDGGFWHNGLATGVSGAVFNQSDGVLLVMNNGYSSATGQQFIPSSGRNHRLIPTGQTIASALRGVGVKWIRTRSTYRVKEMVRTLKEALTTADKGLKVIIAEGECQLARQRRVRAERSSALKAGKRVVRAKYGVDAETCTGDRSCIRLSGCPSLTVAPHPDPLRKDPVAKVIDSCVGCGLCGEVADAAVLCPSFHRADVIHNPNSWDRLLHRVRRSAIRALAPRAAETPVTPNPTLPHQGGGRSVSPAVLIPTLPHQVGGSGEDSISPPPRGEGSGEGGAARSAPPASGSRISILIAAMGGEGGGLLADWIVGAARRAGLIVQSTSIPGVAQRTGATTYYIEMMPPDPSGRMPVFGLYPVPGDVDVAVASELVEAGRLAENGFLTPDRTLLVASSHRVHAMAEKAAMGDGAVDADRIAEAVRNFGRQAVLADFAALAKERGTALNAVLLGAMLAAGRLAFGPEDAEAAIKAQGVAVEANLVGLRAGLEGRRPVERPVSTTLPLFDLSAFPGPVRDVVALGLARTREYQDEAYGELYIRRVREVLAVDRGEAGFELTREAARWLALWMAYEDAMRVADLKSRPERIAGVRAEAEAEGAQPVRITEFFKPGVEEAASLLPARLGRRLVGWSERRGLAERLRVPLRVRTDSILGYASLRLLSRLKRVRRGSLRFEQEQARIERWLKAIVEAAGRDQELALAVAGLGRLVKGYGDTRARANRNFERIMGRLADGDVEAHGLRRAIAAALEDEEGAALERALAPRPAVSGSMPVPQAAE